MEMVSTVGGAMPVTPGVLDHAALHVYTHGQCAALARALHDATGWPLMLAVWTSDKGEDAIHFYVERPDGRVVDITGAHALDVAIQRIERAGGTDVDVGRCGVDVLDEFIDHGFVERGDVDVAQTFVDVVLTLGSPAQRG